MVSFTSLSAMVAFHRDLPFGICRQPDPSPSRVSMGVADLIRLVILAAIWGGSFIFMRVISPVLGPAITASMRLCLAGLTLVIFFAVIRFDVQWRRFWKAYLVIGALNSAIPFLLFSFAAIHIPAGYTGLAPRW